MEKRIEPSEYAYFAGYLDGDGCFYIGKYSSKKRMRQRYVVSIVISSVNKHTLDRFKEVFGGSVRLVKAAHDNNKSLYQFITRKNDSVLICKNIMPFLVEKRDECALALKFAQTNDVHEKEIMINQMRSLKDTANLVSKHHKSEFQIFRNTINPSENDFAYLSGFIDAECCLNVNKYKPREKPNYTYKISLLVNNSKAPVFKWLLERFGGHTNFIDRRNLRRRNQLAWRLSGRALSKILHKIHPFLRHKKPVCEELIKFYATTLTNGGARHTEIFRSHYAEVLKTREDIVAKIHSLNLKGNKTVSG